jgi:hypothetical protein
MPNTLNTLSGIQVVQEVLESLLVQFPIISQIARDFSPEATRFNQQLTTRVIVPTVAIEHDATAGYTATDRTSVDVNVTINKQAEHTYQITDREQSSTIRRLNTEFKATAAHALGTKIVNDLFATVAAASYPLTLVSSPANFDAGDVRKIRTLLNKAGAPDIARFLCINSDFGEGLGLDNLIVANPNGSNAGVINTGVLPNIHGFSPSEYPSLPDNGEKLGGIAGNREGIVMVTRVPELPAPNGLIVPGNVMNVTEPNSGLTVQLRQYYDMRLAKFVESLTVMYGFGVGLSEVGLSKRLVRIITP